jgi:hypothetical protein
MPFLHGESNKEMATAQETRGSSYQLNRVLTNGGTGNEVLELRQGFP